MLYIPLCTKSWFSLCSAIIVRRCVMGIDRPWAGKDTATLGSLISCWKPSFLSWPRISSLEEPDKLTPTQTSCDIVIYEPLYFPSWLAYLPLKTIVECLLQLIYISLPDTVFKARMRMQYILLPLWYLLLLWYSLGLDIKQKTNCVLALLSFKALFTYSTLAV